MCWKLATLYKDDYMVNKGMEGGQEIVREGDTLLLTYGGPVSLRTKSSLSPLSQVPELIPLSASYATIIYRDSALP